MKRSDINAIIRDAEAFFEENKFAIPIWGHWTPEQWRGRTDISGIIDSSLGWDVTDFGSGDYHKRGLMIFVMRNGFAGHKLKSYAEKILIAEENQETPWHFHWSKMEDIINRGGGRLVLEAARSVPESEEVSDEEFTVQIDGITTPCKARGRIVLETGQSIAVEPGLYHRFWAEGGKCLVGEVCRVNDDNTDNRFLEPAARYPDMIEDEPPYRLMTSDYATWV